MPSPLANQSRGGRWLLGSAAVIAYALLTLPIVVLVVFAFASESIVALPSADSVLSAAWLSVQTSLVSLLLMIVLGTPLAYVLARWQFKGKRLFSVLIELPIVMPPAVAGLALLLTFGRQGLLGDSLFMLGIRIPFTSAAVFIAQTFVSVPFFIHAAQIGFASVTDELEDAARVDGATEWQVFQQITLPLSVRSLSAGLILAWARAIGEFGATILLFCIEKSLCGLSPFAPLR